MTALFLRIGVIGALVFMVGCKSTTPTDPLERNREAFKLADQAVTLADEGIAAVQSGDATFEDCAQLQRALDLYAEAHRLQPRSPRLSRDYATLAMQFGEAWNVQRLQLMAEANEAHAAGKDAEAADLQQRYDVAWQRAQTYYQTALPLYRAVTAESTALPRELYAESLWYTALILMTLDRSVDDLEEARRLLQQSMEIGQLSQEWRQRFEQGLEVLQQEIVKRRMQNGGGS